MTNRRPACDAATATALHSTAIDSPWTRRLGLAEWQRLARRRLGTPWSFPPTRSLAWPLALMALLIVLFRATSLDLTISSWFFDFDQKAWTWFFFPPCTAFYRLAIYPPFVLAGIGGAMLLGGWLLDGTDSLPRAGLFLVLMMLIGPGLIVNLGFKTHWGRARPHEVQQFGGRYAFSPVGSTGPMIHGNSSFPSGHAALAFYMMAPGFVVSRHRPKLARGCFLFGLLYGLGMSVTRVVQGGHFTSDVLFSGILMYLLGVVLARVILRNPATGSPATPR